MATPPAHRPLAPQIAGPPEPAATARVGRRVVRRVIRRRAELAKWEHLAEMPS